MNNFNSTYNSSSPSSSTSPYRRRSTSTVPPLCSSHSVPLADSSISTVSPEPPSSPPRSATPVSRLPRCAVVNFRKDGAALAWSPRLSQNLGGLAARVNNFEDAFSLEEFSSRALRVPKTLGAQFHHRSSVTDDFSLRRKSFATDDLPPSKLGRLRSEHHSSIPSNVTLSQDQSTANYKSETTQSQHSSPQRSTIFRSTARIRRAAVSYIKRIWNKDARHRKDTKPKFTCARALSSSSPFGESLQSRMNGNLDREPSDSTITDESDAPGFQALSKSKSPSYTGGRVRYEKKSTSAWKAYKNVSARRRVVSSLSVRNMSLSRRAQRPSDLGQVNGEHEDPYVRFITSEE